MRPNTSGQRTTGEGASRARTCLAGRGPCGQPAGPNAHCDRVAGVPLRRQSLPGPLARRVVPAVAAGKGMNRLRNRSARLTDLALETLEQICRGAVKGCTPRDRFAAANAILDRGHGRPIAPVDLLAINRKVDELSDDLGPVVPLPRKEGEDWIDRAPHRSFAVCPDVISSHSTITPR
jgi:hypothetical protein